MDRDSEGAGRLDDRWLLIVGWRLHNDAKALHIKHSCPSCWL
jgi:hypothetical protein